jgi:hypothetical protein
MSVNERLMAAARAGAEKKAREDADGRGNVGVEKKVEGEVDGTVLPTSGPSEQRGVGEGEKERKERKEKKRKAGDGEEGPKKKHRGISEVSGEVGVEMRSSGSKESKRDVGGREEGPEMKKREESGVESAAGVKASGRKTTDPHSHTPKKRKAEDGVVKPHKRRIVSSITIDDSDDSDVQVVDSTPDMRPKVAEQLSEKRKGKMKDDGRVGEKERIGGSSSNGGKAKAKAKVKTIAVAVKAESTDDDSELLLPGRKICGPCRRREETCVQEVVGAACLACKRVKRKCDLVDVELKRRARSQTPGPPSKAPRGRSKTPAAPGTGPARSKSVVRDKSKSKAPDISTSKAASSKAQPDPIVASSSKVAKSKSKQPAASSSKAPKPDPRPAIKISGPPKSRPTSIDRISDTALPAKGKKGKSKEMVRVVPPDMLERTESKWLLKLMSLCSLTGFPLQFEHSRN